MNGLRFLQELATLKILNRNFIRCRDLYFEMEEAKVSKKELKVFEEDSEYAADFYFTGIRGLASKYHVNEIDLAWNLCFNVKHEEFATI